MKKRSLFSSLVIGLLVSGLFLVGSEKQGGSALEVEDPQKTEELTPISNVIEIKAEGEILHYQKNLFGMRKISRKF